MCGICGVYPIKDTRPNSSRIRNMNSCQRHRGPDEGTQYVTDKIGLGHRRLSIIDPESGSQPISNETDDVIVIFNGEIYNHQSLRENLHDAGHEFVTDADTEVIVHAYEEYGSPGVLHELEGMFAFALWDKSRERLVLARDRMGIKPLYIGTNEQELVFGSELLPLLESEFSHGGVDWNALSKYFVMGQVPSPETAFNNIRKLQAGEYAHVENGDVEYDTYYTPSVSRFTGEYSDATEQLRELVTDAVDKRLMSDVPLGAFLSGGIDSSIIVGTMAELNDDPVKTFTVGFEQEHYDERDAARTVAEYHGTDHTEFIVTADHIREIIPDVLSQLGEPFADPSLLPTYVVAENTARDVTVALSGDGADELFAGYNRYRGEYASAYLRALPSPVVNYGIRPVISALPAHRESRLGVIGRHGKRLVDADYSDISRRHLHWIRPDADVLNECISDYSPIEQSKERLRSEHKNATQELPIDTDLQSIQAVDAMFGLPNQMLTKVDLASMANSLEVRVPFLDNAIVEFAFSLPREYSITANRQKRVLVDAFKDILPAEIRDRSKQGFDMPIGSWFRNELQHELADAIASLEGTPLDVEILESLLQSHVDRDRDHARALWHIYVFSDWYNRMIEKNII